ncbi:tape measure protein [Corynebacterium striatum]|uniref:tape measure protein n=1 Tax=Corynebacterium striatum TaxID=43770 RepID=UPI0027B9DB6F|nr:tape measure protein [Corynebacterium striatum]
MAELGVGYISIVPEVSKISPGIAKALGDTAPVAEKSGQSMGSKLSAGISKTLKASAIGVGTVAGGAIAAGLTKGFGRLNAIEGAQSKLTGLGNSAETVAGVMDNALNAVKGTAHGLGEAASVSASLVASGIKPGQELEQTLKTVGDTAAIAGRSMEDVGLIFGSVAARGKLQGDDMLQLMSSGIPVLQLLADELGVTSAEVSDMVSKGEVDFATFEKAMREGMGGAALEMGDTFSGAVANMGAAAGRVGATALKPFFGLAKDGAGSVTAALDGLNDKLGPVMDSFGSWLTGRGVPALKEFGSSLIALGQSTQAKAVINETKDAVSQLWAAGEKLLPTVVSLMGTLGKASAALGVSAWQIFVSTLQTAGSVLEAVAGPLGSVSGFLSDHPALVTAAVAAWTGFKTVPTIFDKINGVVQPHVNSLKTMGQGVKDIRAYYADTGREISRFDAAVQYAGTSNNRVIQSMAQAYTQASAPLKELSAQYAVMGDAAREHSTTAKDAFTSIDYMAQSAGRSVQSSVTSMAGTMKGVGAAGFAGLKTGAMSVVDALGGPLTVGIGIAVAAIADARAAAASLDAAQQAMTQATRDSAKAQNELMASLAGTTGQMNDQQLAAAAKVAKSELAELIELGGRDFGFVENINMATSSMDKFVAKIPGMYNESGKEAIEASSKNKELKDSYEALTEAAEKANIPMGELGEVVAKGGPEYQGMIENLRGMGDAGNRAADQLEAGREKVQGIVDAAQDVEPAAAQAAKGIDVLADSAASGDEKLSALESVMQAMGLAPKDAERAMMDAAEAVDQLVDSVQQLEVPAEEMGAALFNADGSLSTTNASARELYDQFSTLHDKMMNVAVNGGDVQGVFDTQISPAVDALAEKFGLSAEQAQSLKEQFSLMPEEVKTVVNVNSEGVSGDLAKVYAQLYALEDGQTIEVPLVGDQAMEVLDEIGIKARDLGNGKTMELTATTDEAEEKLSQVSQLMAEIGETPVSPTVFMDTTELQVSADQAKGILEALNIENPSPQAKLIIDDLLNGKGIAQGELDALGAMSPTPKADLNKQLLDNGVSMSNQALDQLGVKRVDPTIGVNNEPARRGINDVQSWLGNIKDHVVNIFTHRHDSGSFRGGRFADGGVVGLAHGGTVGAVTGYRLPKSGPGTSEVDGFQGVDVQGRPTARVDAGEWVINRRSSERAHNLLSAINQGRISDRDASAAGLALADGGVVSAGQLLAFASGKNVNGQQASRSLEGAPYVWGGVNWGDCSGAMSALARFATGASAFAGRFATGSEAAETAALGFKNGLGSGARLALGWFNGGPWGGHTAGTIYDESGNATNVEMGGGRGNGQIGGGAAGAANSQFTNHAYLPLNGGVDIGISDVPGEYDSSPVASTSVDGFTTKSGKSVSWGKAQDLYDKALAFQKMTRVHDNGGVLRSGMLALNLSGKDERILTHSETRGYERGLDILPKVADKFDSAVSKFVYAASPAQHQTVRFGRSFGGDFLSQAEIVQDAEKGLLETRRAIADEADNVSEKEEALAEARKALAEAEAEGGGLSVQQKRKLEDAEEALAKARESGKPDKIADAEKKLARAREDIDADLAKSKDKNAKKVQDAQKKVNKAEDDLSEAREATRDQSDRLIAAERAVAAARYQAAGEMAQTIFDSFARGAKSVEDFFGEMSRLAEVVDRMREEVSKLEMQQKMNAIERLRSLAELQIREQDVARARARGAVDIAKAEEDLQNARNAAAKLGSTSIEAMSGAMDRFRTTGIFSIEKVSESVVENTAEVKAAEWGVKVARAKAALDEFEATRQQALAQFQVAQATLTQTTAAQMLTLQTSQLKAQAAELYGLTANQASGASRGFGGIGKIGGGIGKVIGGVLAGLAGFAAGGPLGALAGAGMALGGITDIARGSIDIHHNKKEMGEAWKKLDAGSKASLLLGAGGSAALGAAGGALAGKFGPDFAKGMGDLSEQWAGATIGSLQYGISSKIEKLQRDQEDQRKALERKISQMENQLSLDKAKGEVDYLTKKNVLESQLEYAKLKQEAAKATNQGVIDALNAAAKVEAERARVEHSENVKLMNATNDHLSKLVELSRNDAGANAETTRQLADAVDGINKVLLSLSARPMSAASGVQFADTRI